MMIGTVPFDATDMIMKKPETIPPACIMAKDPLGKILNVDVKRKAKNNKTREIALSAKSAR